MTSRDTTADRRSRAKGTSISEPVAGDSLEALRAENTRLQRRLAEYERSEVGLREFHARFQAVLDSAPTAIAITDLQGRHVLVNRRWLALVGRAEADALGQTSRDLFPAEYAAALTAAERTARHEGRPVEFDRRVPLPAGDLALTTCVFPLHDDAGAVQGLCCFASDVSERQRAQDALRESEQRYRGLFDSSPLAMWEADLSGIRAYVEERRAQGVRDLRHHFEAAPEALRACAARARVIDVNHATLQLMGVAEKGMVVGPLTLPRSPDALGVFHDAVCALADGGTVFEGEAEYEDAAGELKAFNVKLAIAPGYERTWARVWAAVADISRRRQAEAAARTAEHDAAKLATAHHMIATLHHEINNPLQWVLGYAEYLQDKVGDRHEFAKPIEKIFRGALKIEALMRRLESLARVETTTYLGEARMVDLERSTTPGGSLDPARPA